MPDASFIANRNESLCGIIATHAHEDHIGAIHHLWEQFRCPVYTTPFTRNVLLGKLRRAGIDAPVITVHQNETHTLGPFRVTWLPITHSTPETCALLIESAVGRALHTADWKLDSAPIAGQAVDPQQYVRAGDQGIDAVICDSTNSMREGMSVSESELFEGLLELVQDSSGRVVVGCFSSNVARLQTLGNIARVSGRYLGLLGRSIKRMVTCARSAGYLQENFNVVDSYDMGYLLPGEMLCVATGSQGETGAALSRLAADTHPDMNLAAGDHVVFSAKTIPGNEAGVQGLVRAFEERGIRVTHADDWQRPIHASGHPCAAELREMYGWLRPRIAVPVHGEDMHMLRNAELASSCGVPLAPCGRNGDLFDLVTGQVKRSAVNVGRFWFDENQQKLRRVQRGPSEVNG